MGKIGMTLPKLSLKHRISEEIRKAIFEGRLLPGEKITESQLSKELGVSRAPIREAIQLLEMEGILDSTPYKETKVSNISKEEVIELLIPIRMQIESYALKKSLPIWTEEHFNEFQSILDEMKKGAQYRDFYVLVDADIRFHEQIIKYANMEGITKIWESIVNRIRLHFIVQGKEYEDFQEIVDEHQVLFDCFLSRNISIALEGLNEHIVEKNLRDNI
ncbi:GntR family transcriptional regulator [Peribacillus muralis]|uniref:GntR family transcriptional regulator n=1 Tax=Peribacillus muralis TaxID=264697 RepID=UPI001F4E445B|nr:GntR family transcriptional regulator [Peribacillus muralis]MCK1992934.1 GntR family transcriptional regulator [Peribacillus muralis]MCK2013489.1 GntR family transcriptional regulator [Peribacillus muralis]